MEFITPDVKHLDLAVLEVVYLLVFSVIWDNKFHCLSHFELGSCHLQWK